MKHIKLFEQWDDYNLDDIFGKEPELKLIKYRSSGDIYIIEKLENENDVTFLYDNHYGEINDLYFIKNPKVFDDDVVNIYIINHWKQYLYKDLPKEIKDRL